MKKGQKPIFGNLFVSSIKPRIQTSSYVTSCSSATELSWTCFVWWWQIFEYTLRKEPNWNMKIDRNTILENQNPSANLSSGIVPYASLDSEVCKVILYHPQHLTAFVATSGSMRSWYLLVNATARAPDLLHIFVHGSYMNNHTVFLSRKTRSEIEVIKN